MWLGLSKDEQKKQSRVGVSKASLTAALEKKVKANDKKKGA